MLKHKLEKERGYCVDSINSTLISIFNKIKKNEAQKDFISNLNDSWKKFAEFQYYQCNLTENVLNFYKTIDYELDRLNKCISSDNDFAYLHLQISMVNYMFEYFLEDPDEFFNNNSLENMQKSFSTVFDLTEKIFSIQKEIDCKNKLANSSKSNQKNSTGKDKNFIDASNAGYKIILDEKKELLKRLQNVYLLKCKECSIDTTKYEHLVDIAFDSKNNIDEYESIKSDSIEKIDDICLSVLNKKPKTVKFSEDSVVLTKDDADEMKSILKSIESEIVSSNDKLDSLDSKIDANFKDIQDLVKTCSKSSIDSIIDEFKKLDVNSLTNQISGLQLLIENSKNYDHETEKTIYATETAIAEKNLSLSDFVKWLYKDGITENKITSAYANIRALIDAYCRYSCGVQLNAQQRPFGFGYPLVKYVDGVKRTINATSKIDLYKLCFKDDSVAGAIRSIDVASNQYIHRCAENIYDLKEDAKSTIKAAEYLNNLGIDFSKINYKAGIEKLIAQENEWKKSINSNIARNEQKLSNLKKEASAAILFTDEEKLNKKINEIININLKLKEDLKYLDNRLDNFNAYLRSAENAK